MTASQQTLGSNDSSPARPHFGQRRRKVIFWMRVGVILFAFFGLWQLSQRFELVRLPEDRCSPLASFLPGVSLLVDRQPERLYLDDAVLFELPDGGLGLGRIGVPPGSAPGTLRTDVGYWILGDVPDCDTPDSQEYGAFVPEVIVARVLFPIHF